MDKQKSHDEVLVTKSLTSVPGSLTTHEPTFRDSYAQITAACTVHLLVIQHGINMAFAAILTPRLMEPDSDLKLETWEAPWIASLVTISVPIGCLMSGPLMDRYGRTKISLYVCIPYFVSWILIFWASNVVWLYVGRVLAGGAAGTTAILFPGVSGVYIVYTSETANSIWRPMLLGLNAIFASLGILLTAILGSYFHWRTVAVIFAALTAVVYFLITFLPESPHWLLSFGNGTQNLKRMTEARKSINWLYRDEYQAEKEFNQLLITYRTGSAASNVENETLREKWESLKKPEIYKPIILLLVIFFFQQTAGVYVVIFYATDFFRELGGNFGFLDAYSAMVAMGTFRLIMAIGTFFLSRKFGRRTLSLISSFGMGTSMLVAYVYMEVSKSENQLPSLVCVLLYVCSSAIGWQTIPWTLTGELLPTKVRALVGGIMLSYGYFLMFIAVQTFPDLKALIYIKGVFLTYAILSFLSGLFVWKYLPETFGKTLAEIEESFK